MKILAAFDGSIASEAALQPLGKIARSGDDVLLLSVLEVPHGGPRMRGPLRPVVAMTALPGATPVVVGGGEPRPIETKSQAIERQLSDRSCYLKRLIARLPHGPRYACEAHLHSDPAAAIVERALTLQPDLIVMATHGHTGLVHILFGDVAEEIVRSGVAPVLLVHPDNVREARRGGGR